MTMRERDTIVGNMDMADLELVAARRQQPPDRKLRWAEGCKVNLCWQG